MPDAVRLQGTSRSTARVDCRAAARAGRRAGVTFGVFFLAAVRVATRAREVRVPDLRGQSVADAKAKLASVGLVLKVDPVRRPDPKVAADHVLTQDPEPGTVLRRQRAVRVRVSDGQREPVVRPWLAGRSEPRKSTLAGDRVTVVVTRRDQDRRLSGGHRRRPGPVAEKPRRPASRCWSTAGRPIELRDARPHRDVGVRSRRHPPAPISVSRFPAKPPIRVCRRASSSGRRRRPDSRSRGNAVIALEVSR